MIDRQERVMIAPQILFHTHRELVARGLDPGRDPHWQIFDAEGRLPNNQRISFVQSQTLLMRALDLTGDPDLGLAVGFRQSFGSFGLIAAAMLTSATLRESVEVALRFHAVLGTMLDFHPALLPGGDLAITVQSRFPGSPVRRFLMQEATVLILTAARFLSPGVNPVARVATPFRPRDPRPFLARCGCPVEFGAEAQVITLKGAVLAAPNPLADPFALGETIAALDMLFAAAQRERDLLDAVEARMQRALPQVESPAQMAAAFGLSERSLRRRLEDSGTSFRALLHGVRLARARQCLAEGLLTREEIALSLGFEDARSLRRMLAAERSAR